MRRKKSKIPIVIGAAVVVVVGAVVINSNKSKKVDYSSMSDEELQVAVQEKIDEMEVNNLAGMGERDRMEYYVSSFVKAVENGEYEDAYNMLYEDFRKNYFPTLSSFEEYAKSKFPTMFSLEHTNFERNGDVYVLWVTLSNPLGSKDSGIEMNFVVQENDLNDFVMSFTVI
jgi:hypothetical protein